MKLEDFVDEKILNRLRSNSTLRYGVLAVGGFFLYQMGGILRAITSNVLAAILQFLLAMAAVLCYLAATNPVSRFDPNKTLKRSYLRSFYISVVCYVILIAETILVLLL